MISFQWGLAKQNYKDIQAIRCYDVLTHIQGRFEANLELRNAKIQGGLDVYSVEIIRKVW